MVNEKPIAKEKQDEHNDDGDYSTMLSNIIRPLPAPVILGYGVKIRAKDYEDPFKDLF